jgi:hypothetical protein
MSEKNESAPLAKLRELGREAAAKGDAIIAVDEATARSIASQWHSGQWSALYSFASSGYVHGPVLTETYQCMNEASPEDCAELEALATYIRMMLPTAPFVICQGLQGGYMANRVEHYENIEEARSGLVDELERAADYLAEGIELDTHHPEASQNYLDALDRAKVEVSAMPAAELAQGYAIATDQHEYIELAPLDPSDYDPEGCE